MTSPQRPSAFAKALADSMPRMRYLLGEALAGRSARVCTLKGCRLGDREHFYAPDCKPRDKELLPALRPGDGDSIWGSHLAVYHRVPTVQLDGGADKPHWWIRHQVAHEHDHPTLTHRHEPIERTADMGKQMKVYRETPEGPLVPVEQVPHSKTALTELHAALGSFIEQAAADDRLILTLQQARTIKVSLDNPAGDRQRIRDLEARCAGLEQHSAALATELAGSEARRESAESQLRQAYDQPPPLQGIALTIHGNADLVMTYQLADGRERAYVSREPVDEPHHSIGTALLQVAATEWAGLARPQAQAAQSGPPEA